MHPEIPVENEIMGLPTIKYMRFLFKTTFQVTLNENSWRPARFAFSNKSKVSCNWPCFFRKKAARGDIKNRAEVRVCGDLTQHTGCKFCHCFHWSNPANVNTAGFKCWFFKIFDKQKIIDVITPQSAGNAQKMLTWAIQPSFLVVHIKTR